MFNSPGFRRGTIRSLPTAWSGSTPIATDARQRVAASRSILSNAGGRSKRSRGRKPLPQKHINDFMEHGGFLFDRPCRRVRYSKTTRLLGVADDRFSARASGPFRGSLERLDGIRPSATGHRSRQIPIQRSGPLLAGRRLRPGSNLYGDRRPLAQGWRARHSGSREPLRRGLRVEE